MAQNTHNNEWFKLRVWTAVNKQKIYTPTFKQIYTHMQTGELLYRNFSTLKGFLQKYNFQKKKKKPQVLNREQS